MAIKEPPVHAIGDKGLQAGALGLVGNMVIGLASVAPAYSLAATLGYVVLAVGEKAPSMFVLAFIPMLLVAFAYRELSQDTPDCGTTFTWGTKAFGPWIGWIGGWGLAVSAIIVLANVAEVAAIYLFKFLGLDDLAESLTAKVLLGSFFIISMTLDQCPRHRAVRTNSVRADRHPVRGTDHRQHHRADPRLQRHRRRSGDHAGVELAVARRTGRVLDRRGDHLVHLHLLGLGRLSGRRRGNQGRRQDPGPRRRPRHTDPGRHLRAGRLRGAGLRRVQRRGHRPEQRGERRRRAHHSRRARLRGARGVAAAVDGVHLGVVVDPDHHPADGARDAVHGRLRGDPQTVRLRASALHDSGVRHHGDGVSRRLASTCC